MNTEIKASGFSKEEVSNLHASIVKEYPTALYFTSRAIASVILNVDGRAKKEVEFFLQTIQDHGLKNEVKLSVTAKLTPEQYLATFEA